MLFIDLGTIAVVLEVAPIDLTEKLDEGLGFSLARDHVGDFGGRWEGSEQSLYRAVSIRLRPPSDRLQSDRARARD